MERILSGSKVVVDKSTATLPPLLNILNNQCYASMAVEVKNIASTYNGLLINKIAKKVEAN
ncbi:hypothetical protein [Bacteroides sp.]|uniref:hypothetical protein n=1 Tax=Bacteroides sp. TaxID=29523 RepID=UPI002611C1AE|nr:hypothetical protein [Bacteroides sp.]